MTKDEYKWQDVFTEIKFNGSVEFPLDFVFPENPPKPRKVNVVERDNAMYISEVEHYITLELECFTGHGTSQEEAMKQVEEKINKRSLDLLKLAAVKNESKKPDYLYLDNWHHNTKTFVENIQIYKDKDGEEQYFIFVTSDRDILPIDINGNFHSYLNGNFIILDTRRVSLVENVVS